MLINPLIFRNHVCQPIPYQPENLALKIVKRPNFRLETYQTETGIKRNLYIYADVNKLTCYSFIWLPETNLYTCRECNKKKRRVTAKLVQNMELGTFVQLGSVQHVCQPLPRDKFLHPSLFKFDFMNGKVSRILVFTTHDKYHNYIFLPYTENIYRCHGCDIRSKHCAITLIKNENGLYCVKMTKQFHFCQPYPKELSPAPDTRLYHV